MLHGLRVTKNNFSSIIKELKLNSKSINNRWIVNQCKTEEYLSEIDREQELFLTIQSVFCLQLKIVLNYKKFED